MENTTNLQSNCTTYYNAVQFVLPLNIDTIVPDDSELFSFLKAIEGVDFTKYIRRTDGRGRKGNDRDKLLRTVLFGYMNGITSLHDLEHACRYDIRFMYLMDRETPSFMSFERFIKNYLMDSIDNIWTDITRNICTKMGTDLTTAYIDGTKIEACAGKYTFVYKTRITNQILKSSRKINEMICMMNQELGYAYRMEYIHCSQYLGSIAQYLMEVMVHEDITPAYGRGKRKSTFQKYYDWFLEMYVKFDEYEYWLDIIGERNSCSKTDHDATMCATKMDYYCHTGLSRPCYNAQIAVSDGIIVNAALYQNPGDTKTFIPFMERYHDTWEMYPVHPVADAGYGSYDNYMYCLEHDMGLDMKYSYYAKKNDPKFRKLIYNTMNWKKDENGHKVCPAGTVFDEYAGDTADERGEYLKISHLYRNHGQCENCPMRSECCRKTEYRTVSRNTVLEEFYGTVDGNLSTEEGKERKKQRSVQAEGTFGVLKEDMGFTRFTRRGMKNAEMEFLLVCIGFNLRKYHRFLMKQRKAEKN